MALPTASAGHQRERQHRNLLHLGRLTAQHARKQPQTRRDREDSEGHSEQETRGERGARARRSLGREIGDGLR